MSQTQTTTVEPFEIRRLELGDYYKGIMELLGQLTIVGPVSYTQFQYQLKRMSEKEVYVIEDNGRIIATGTLMLEPKLVHRCGTVGHIEDVVIDSKYRGKHLGIKLTQHLVKMAQQANCYKIVLDCADYNVSFYERCGFKKKEVEMAIYFN